MTIDGITWVVWGVGAVCVVFGCAWVSGEEGCRARFVWVVVKVFGWRVGRLGCWFLVIGVGVFVAGGSSPVIFCPLFREVGRAAQETVLGRWLVSGRGRGGWEVVCWHRARRKLDVEERVVVSVHRGGARREIGSGGGGLVPCLVGPTGWWLVGVMCDVVVGVEV